MSAADGLDRPACNRVQCRGAHGLAGPHAEAGMMPGTAHRVADQQAFREGTAVVRAGCVDRKYLIARSGQDHLILSNVAKQHGAVSEQLDLYTLGEIGAGRFRLVCIHGNSSTADQSNFRSVHRNEVLQAVFTHWMRTRGIRTPPPCNSAAPTIARHAAISE